MKKFIELTVKKDDILFFLKDLKTTKEVVLALSNAQVLEKYWNIVNNSKAGIPRYSVLLRK